MVVPLKCGLLLCDRPGRKQNVTATLIFSQCNDWAMNWGPEEQYF
jgi:hypothetical protein